MNDYERARFEELLDLDRSLTDAEFEESVALARLRLAEQDRVRREIAAHRRVFGGDDRFSRICTELMRIFNETVDACAADGAFMGFDPGYDAKWEHARNEAWQVFGLYQYDPIEFTRCLVQCHMIREGDVGDCISHVLPIEVIWDSL